MPTLTEFNSILTDGAAIALLSFISGVLTAKSFARRNRYDIDANQELIGFGACNIVSGLAQGFPVTGADSRTAVNNAMGGKSQIVGLVAAGTMLLSKRWQLHRSRFRTIHPQRQMSTPAMIIIKIAGQDSFQMTLVQHDDMVQAI
jgi:hypothetical protein